MRVTTTQTHTSTAVYPHTAHTNEPEARQSTEPDFRVEHRRLIRTLELEQAVSFFGLGKRVLEIGAGAGWQAKLLARKGYQVTAIDVPHSNYIALREWNVITYDGVHIPAPNRYFDVIFSSNVLEHVSDLASLQREMFRVLKPGGIGVHIMPTPTWRLWTTCTFYVKRVAQAFSLLRTSPDPQSTKSTSTQCSKSRLTRLLQAALPHRHGDRGCWISEFYLFSEGRWRRALENNNWEVIRITSNNLLYSGTRLFGDYLSVEWRRRLSSVLGSSCKIYVVRRSLVSTLDTGLMSAD